eukprot:CAMPEP_0183413826 /NCGR_PEP_ID=MMETSP0370-20130417/21961_1 /TAXON_ID=268820 /ORGANISM="Peridinium aciculiferum, Strain PAER-2" /LENGTH=68 /DNA_ID=CAMNT_0025597081 /DNA_START=8 /DNA_END=210 /DNA_ORIENTATION=+
MAEPLCSTALCKNGLLMLELLWPEPGVEARDTMAEPLCRTALCKNGLLTLETGLLWPEPGVEARDTMA